MPPAQDGDNPGTTPAGGAPRELRWTDAAGRAWLLRLAPDELQLEHGDESFSIPSADWPRDVYVAAHPGSFVIRFETFDHAVGFQIPAADAEPMLKYLGSKPAPEAAPEPPEEEPAPRVARPIQYDQQPEERREQPLHWPKVSPLAIWAVICSGLAMIPILGWLAAAATVGLLWQHRQIVPRSPAWRHSRALCVLAFVILMLGLLASAMAAWGVRRNMDRLPGGQGPELYRIGAVETVPSGDADNDSHRLSMDHDRKSLADFRSARSTDFWNKASGAGPMSETRHVVRLSAGSPSPHMLGAGLLAQERSFNWSLIVAAIFVVVLSLTVHEAAHAISAWWLGDDLAKRLGRVTLNPTVHIDPLGTIALPLVLFLAGAGIFGWARPVPVQVENLPNPRRAHILIALAGPGSNLLLASVSISLILLIAGLIGVLYPDATVENLTVFGFSQGVTASGFALAPLVGPLCTILKLSFIVNIFLAFFNLIPIPPLDGSWVMEHLFPHTLGPIYARVRPYAFLLFVGLIYTGILRFLLLPAIVVLQLGFALLSASVVV